MDRSGMHAMNEQDRRRQRAKRNALWLGAAALGVYLTYMVYLYFWMRGG